MSLLRLFLVCWLTIAVPTAALASVVNAGHCQRLQQGTQAMPGMDHSQHMRHVMHDPSQAPQQDRRSSHGCTCGCYCLEQHCTAGFSGFLGATGIQPAFPAGAGSQILQAEPGHLASAHPLDLIRPPSLN
jgi:hypothetical protein